MFSSNHLTIWWHQHLDTFCRLLFAGDGLLRSLCWDFFNLVLRLELVMGIPLGHRRDVSHRLKIWPYGDWMQFLNFWLLIPTLLCMHFFRRPLLFMYGSVSGPCSLWGREGCGISGTCSVGGGEDCGIGCGISCTCSLGGWEECGSSGKWWSRDGKSTSPSSTTPSKCWTGSEEAVNTMSRLCQRTN
jgi:hypothetical protein